MSWPPARLPLSRLPAANPGAGFGPASHVFLTPLAHPDSDRRGSSGPGRTAVGYRDGFGYIVESGR